MLLARFDAFWLMIDLASSGDDENRLETNGVLCDDALGSAVALRSEGALIGSGARLDPGRS